MFCLIQGCPGTTTCFALPEASCPEPTTTTTTTTTTPMAESAMVADASTEATEAAPAFLMVCGATYSDAQRMCRFNEQCPTGDVSFV